MSRAMWIWHWGDFEIWQHMLLSLRREDRGLIRPAFWKLDDCYRNVMFRKKCFLDKSEAINIHIEGVGFVTINDKRMSVETSIILDSGEYDICISVANATGLPCVYVEGESLASDEKWDSTSYNGKWQRVGCWNLYDVNCPPSKFALPTKEVKPYTIERQEGKTFIDFGQETFSKLKLSGISGNGQISVFYGETKEEAYSKEQCTLFKIFQANQTENTLTACAFRFIYIEHSDVHIAEISALYEYLPLEYKGKFKCSNDKINKIWDVAAYTIHLNSREFFLDGIKRDRWVWSGDAYQTYLMNYYLFFNNDICNRTMIALRGKDPVERHINTILDYSFYWFIGIYDYYLYTGDLNFIKNIYPKMVTLMDFCLSRRTDDGLMDGKEDDWVFIDWADIDKKGAVCAEQLLFCKSLETMAQCADFIGQDGEKYKAIANELQEKIHKIYWCDKKGVFIDSYYSGEISDSVTRHANIFALLFDYVGSGQFESICQNVLLNEKIAAIKTPYFKFYELEAMCKIGNYNYITNVILDYWGGMLDLGATSFWEEYDSKKKGAEHYRMYDTDYDKSLCHAWGGSPVYLLGKYYLGVKPISAGYATFEVSPNLGGLEWVEGTVPTPNGEVYVYASQNKIIVETNITGGILKFHCVSKPSSSEVEIRGMAENMYAVVLPANKRVEISINS